jgi:hypothetical protein
LTGWIHAGSSGWEVLSDEQTLIVIRDRWDPSRLTPKTIAQYAARADGSRGGLAPKKLLT